MGYCQPYHRTVGQIDRTLYETFSKSASSHHCATVLILHCASHYLCCGGGIFIHENHHFPFLHHAVTFCLIFHSRHSSASSIYYKVVLWKQFIGYIDSSLQITTSITLEIEHEMFHSLLFQFLQAFHKLTMGSGTETANTYISYLRAYHISGVYGVDGNLVACHLKRENVANTPSYHTEHHLRTLGSPKPSHDFFLSHLHSSYGGIVNADDAVSSYYSHLL